MTELKELKNAEGLAFVISKEDCQAVIDKNGCVCKRCGGMLSPIQTVDNGGSPTHWSGCLACEVYDYGVKPIVHEVAHQLVTKRFYRAYHHEQEPDATKNPMAHEYWLKSQIGGISSQVQETIFLYEKLRDGGIF